MSLPAEKRANRDPIDTPLISSVKLLKFNHTQGTEHTQTSWAVPEEKRAREGRNRQHFVVVFCFLLQEACPSVPHYCNNWVAKLWVTDGLIQLWPLSWAPSPTHPPSCPASPPQRCHSWDLNLLNQQRITHFSLIQASSSGGGRGKRDQPFLQRHTVTYDSVQY